MSRTKKVLIGVLAGVVLLVGAGIVAVATLDWNRFKPMINERVSAAMGRPFAINGDLSVRWARMPTEQGWRAWVPWPHVSARDLTVGNTEWARTPVMARLDEVRFSLAPVPLLARVVSLREIQLTGARADLQRLKDGRANWEFTLPESGEPSPWRVDIDRIAFDQGVVAYADEVVQADMEIQVNPLGKPVPFAELAGKPDPAAAAAADAKLEAGKEGGQPANGEAGKETEPDEDDKALAQAEDATRAKPDAMPGDYVFGWSAKGRYRDLPVKGEGKVGGMLALKDASQPFPVQADVSVGRTRAAVTGTLTDPLNLGALDLKLALSGSSMANLYPLTGITLPDTPPYDTQGRLIANLRNSAGAVFEYRGFSGKVGRSDLSGTLRFALRAPRPKLTGTLRSDQLRMADLGPLIGVKPEGQAAASEDRESASAERRDKVLPTQEFRTERWAAMDADVRFTGKRIVHSSRLPLSDLDTHVVLDGGKLTLDPLRFGISGGTIASTLSLDGSVHPMNGRIQANARGLRLKQLFPDVESMQRALGQLNGSVGLAGRGNSVAALLGSADGDLRLLVNDGVISRSLMEIAGLNVGNYVITKLFGDDEVQINCAAADLGMKNGLMQTRAFVFDTENAVVTVDGSVNFKNETLDLDISPESKGFRIFSLRSPLYVRGTFAKPDAGVHAGPLVARGAGMLALGVVLTPAAGLLALIAPSSDEPDNQCAQMLQQARKPAKAPAR
ncbi:AsmA family protein [Bordetella sp. 2513F-2]